MFCRAVSRLVLESADYSWERSTIGHMPSGEYARLIRILGRKQPPFVLVFDLRMPSGRAAARAAEDAALGRRLHGKNAGALRKVEKLPVRELLAQQGIDALAAAVVDVADELLVPALLGAARPGFLAATVHKGVLGSEAAAGVVAHLLATYGSVRDAKTGRLVSGPLDRDEYVLLCS